MATQQWQFQSNAGGQRSGGGGGGSDTTYTKIFVGGLAWETQRDTMSRYFEQFGEILEAVVITDKHTGRSKGYGFVTFKDPDSAMRACQDPTPVIDGRRANCNLASLGATHRPRPPTPQYGPLLRSQLISQSLTLMGSSRFTGTGRFRPAMGTTMVSSAYRGSTAASASTTYYHQPAAQYAYPYSFYGYSGGYTQESMYPMNYYGIAGAQQHQFSPYYPSAGPGFVQSFYPYYTQYGQASQLQGGYGLHYTQVPQYNPYLPQFGSGSGVLSLPTSIAATTAAVVTIAPSSSLQPRANPDHKPSV